MVTLYHIRRPPMILLFAKWGSFSILVLLTVAFVISLLWPTFYQINGYAVGLDNGVIRCMHWHVKQENGKWIATHIYGTDTLFVFPLWIGVIASGLVAMLIFLSHRSPISRSCCTCCGYDLRLNRAGICPECGAKVDQFRRVS